MEADHECRRCDDFSPMERELVAQARLITAAKYEMREQDLIEAMRQELKRA